MTLKRALNGRLGDLVVGRNTRHRQGERVWLKVAEAFEKFERGSNSDGLTIDATAL
jgi:hypothetical protein